jgi:hypothetical protein
METTGPAEGDQVKGVWAFKASIPLHMALHNVKVRVFIGFNFIRKMRKMRRFQVRRVRKVRRGGH